MRQGLVHIASMSVDLLTVKLEKLIYGGDALGRLPDGRAVFIPFGLPGETVRARIIDEKRGHVRAELVEIVDASPDRIEARCKHFGICGGCHYQNLSYLEQQKVKTGVLVDQLMRIGKIESPPVDELVPSPNEWNYRNHIQFHLSRSGKLGFIEALSANILPIQECHLPEDRMNSLWPTLGFDPGLELERVSLRQGMDEQIMMILESGNSELPALELEADLSVVHTTEEDSVVMAGDDHLLMQVNGRNFHVSSGSFFQVNSAVAGLMADHLLAQLPVSTSTTMLDVYCGVGFFSAFFAARVGRLIGIESVPSACEDFSINLDEYENVELFEAPAEQVLPSLDVSPEVVIVDPPRAGLERRVLDAIVALAPDHLAYVSCDPATLARDASRLMAGGYRLKQVTPFDLFPQTYHIESISIFEKG